MVVVMVVVLVVDRCSFPISRAVALLQSVATLLHPIQRRAHAPWP